MKIYSQDFITHETTQHRVIHARDRLACSDVCIRRARDQSGSAIASIKKQFLLQRALSQSGAVDVHDLILNNGSIAGFSMPVLEGEVLSDSVAKLEPEGLLAVLRDAAFTIFGLHSLGFIHGDLTANNVWVAENNGKIQGLLLDFEFSALIGTRLLTEVRGTPGHISPEAMLGQPLGPGVDSFSFGRMIEGCLAYCDDMAVRDRLGTLSLRCVSEKGRFQEFSEIYFSIMRIARDCIDANFPHSRHLLPLRRTGLISRARTLRDRLAASHHAGLLCCHGEVGSGKSEMIRYVCHEVQECGVATIRFAKVSSCQEFTGVLGPILSASGYGDRYTHPLIFVESLPDCRSDARAKQIIQEIAADQRVTIVFELGPRQEGSGISKAKSFLCRSLTFRECMHATGHLLANRGIVVPNTEAVYAATGGNPGSIRSAMTWYFLSGRRGRGEPIDWARAVCSNNMTEQSRSTSARPPEHRAPSEQHANSTGREDPSLAVQTDLSGHQHSLSQLLLEYRRGMRSGKPQRVSLSRRISDLFGQLGSLRRQSRWLRRAVADYSHISNSEHDEGEWSNAIAILGSALTQEQAIREFELLLKGDRGFSKKLRCMLRFELGASYLYANRLKDAQIVLHEALALASGRDGEWEFEAPVLNRLGTTKLLLREFSSAREYFIQASRAAQRHGDEKTMSRVEGNLGFLAQQCGEPAVASHWLRRHKSSALKGRHYPEYLSSLLNQAGCYTDLGKGFAAERGSRLAVSIAETLSDDMRLAYALNNFGWIMNLRCHAAKAIDSFNRALAIRTETGDAEGLAQTYLNVARLHLQARSYDPAREFALLARKHFTLSENQEGIWDCERVLVKQALLLVDYDHAARMLEGLETHFERMNQKDLVDALLLKLEVLLWSGNVCAATQMLKSIDDMSTVSVVHPLKIRRTMCGGVLASALGDLDSAHAQISLAISMCRESNREDLLLEATTTMAVIANRMGNAVAGLRFLRYVESTAARMRKEIE